MKYLTILLIFCISNSCKEKTQHYNHYNNVDSSKSYGKPGDTIWYDTSCGTINGRIVYVGDSAILGEYKIVYDIVYIHDTIVQRVGRGNNSRYFNTTDSIVVVGDNNYIITHEK